MKKNTSSKEAQSSTFRIPKWILVVLILNLCGIVGIGTVMLTTKKKTAFVDLGKMYEGFEMSKQKQTQLQSLSFNYKNALDSLSLEIKSLENALMNNYNTEIDQKLQLKKI